MKMDFWKIGTIILASILLVGFGVFLAKQFNLEQTNNDVQKGFFIQEGHLEGEIFIVTQGGQNFKLGLVPVMVSSVDENGKKRIVRELKTNSDGKFNLTLPRGRYEISASSSRRIFDKTEYYTWIIPVELTQEKQIIMLSNDNLIMNSN
jgi:hypothetical protein